MHFLCTNTFSPLALSLGLLLAMATAFPTRGPLGEDSKEEATSRPEPLTSPDQTEKLIKSIMLEISEVKKKMCDNQEACKNSKEVLTENNLNLPKLTRGDGCFQTGFNQKTCSKRLTAGLVEFQVYLQYLQHSFEDHAKAMQMRIKALVNTLRQKNPDEEAGPEPSTDAGLLAQMRAQSEWRRTTTLHLILRSLEDFLQFAQRAARVM